MALEFLAAWNVRNNGGTATKAQRKDNMFDVEHTLGSIASLYCNSPLSSGFVGNCFSYNRRRPNVKLKGLCKRLEPVGKFLSRSVYWPRFGEAMLRSV